jgi:predicted ArsR family transcriptional regulator
VDRLALLKALGDDTRYAIYHEVARAAAPVSTSEVAEILGLHPNTVRPHLERMRTLGLLEVAVDARGTVGRPQHRYSLAAHAPSLGLEPPTFQLLAKLSLSAAAAAGAGREEAADAGREAGGSAAATRTAAPSCLEALVEQLTDLGFDPAVGDGPDEDTVAVAFTHCPYRDLAEAFPDLVCHLHRGLVEGFVERMGGSEVVSFGTLVDRDPCQVVLSAG